MDQTVGQTVFSGGRSDGGKQHDGIKKYFTSKKVSNFCFLKLWNRKENAIKIAVLIIKTEYISCIVDALEILSDVMNAIHSICNTC